MKTYAVALTTGLMVLTFTDPAIAGDRHNDRQWHQGHSQQYRQPPPRMMHPKQMKRQRSQAYAQGYRDGARANQYYRDPRYSQNYMYRTPPRYSSSGYQNQYWWGQNGRVSCRRPDGTVGTIVGAVAGGMLGNMIAQQGDKQIGTVIGGALGAVLGNQVAKGTAQCR